MSPQAFKSILPEIVIGLLLAVILIDGFRGFFGLINYFESSTKPAFQDSLADQNTTPSYPPALVQEPMHGCIPIEVDPNDYFNRYRDRLAMTGDWIGLPELSEGKVIGGFRSYESGGNQWGFMNCGSIDDIDVYLTKN